MVNFGGSVSSRRRKKINYNSFYNNNLRNNRFLEYHPENKRVTAISLNPYSQFGGVGEVTTSRAILAPAIESAPSLITPTTTPSDLQKYYVIEETTNINLAAQSFEEVMNEAEDGEILAIEAITSSPLITIEVVIYGMGNTPNIINDLNINEMVQRGRGLTPGDVELLPGGRSKDSVGVPRRYYPYISRYKDDTLVDYFNKSRRTYVFTYEPAIPLPYSSIIINVKNTSTEGDRTVDSVNIHRRVYESPFADHLAGTPIESSVLFKKEEVVAVGEEQTPVTSSNVQPTNSSSPYIANYLKRQQELVEAANMPEIVPSDDV